MTAPDAATATVCSQATVSVSALLALAELVQGSDILPVTDSDSGQGGDRETATVSRLRPGRNSSARRKGSRGASDADGRNDGDGSQNGKR